MLQGHQVELQQNQPHPCLNMTCHTLTQKLNHRNSLCYVSSTLHPEIHCFGMNIQGKDWQKQTCFITGNQHIQWRLKGLMHRFLYRRSHLQVAAPAKAAHCLTNTIVKHLSIVCPPGFILIVVQWAPCHHIWAHTTLSECHHPCSHWQTC